MFDIVCTILLVTRVGAMNMTMEHDVEGKLLSRGYYANLVDFSQGVQKVDGFVGNPSDYKKKIVDRNKCVKE